MWFDKGEIIMAKIGMKTVIKRIKMIETEKKKTDKKVKHGKWLINSDGYYPYCSCCMREPESGTMTDYCPNCGAKMDLKE